MARNEQAKATIYLDGKQAEAALDSIKKKASELRAQMKEAQKAGDNVKYKKLQSELKGVEAAQRSLKKETFDYKKVLNDLSGASIPQLTKAERKLNAMLRSPAVKRGTKEWEQYKRELRAVRAEKKRVNKELYSTASSGGPLAKLKNAAGGLLPAFGFAAIISGAVALGKRLFMVADQTMKYRQQMQQLSGETGQALADLTAKVDATAKTFNKDFKELAVANHNFAESMGISEQQANNLINKGFLAGADASGEFIDRLREYGPQFRAAGISAEQAIAIMTQEVQSGIYSDKGTDAIKEATIAIREMTPVTREAIEGIGLSSAKLEADLRSGAISYFDAIQMISNKMAELPPQSTEVGAALADIFKGAGEDAGLDYITMLGNVEGSMDKLVEGAGETAQAQQKLLDANQKLSDAWSELLGTGTGTFTAIKATAKVLLADGLMGVVNGIKGIRDWFIALYNESLPVRAGIQYMMAMWKTSITIVKTALQSLWEQLKLGGRLFKAIFTFDVQGIKDAITQWGDAMKTKIVDNAKSVGNAWANAYNETVKGKIEPVKQKVEVETSTENTTTNTTTTNQQSTGGGQTSRREELQMQVVAAKEKFDLLAKQEQDFTQLELEELEKRKQANTEWAENEKENIESLKQAQQDLTNAKIDAAGQAIQALIQLAGEESKIGKALFLLDQARAVGQVIFNTGIANAKAVAASPLTGGMPWVAINTATAAASIASILAQTISKFSGGSDEGFKSGGYTDHATTDDEVVDYVHSNEFVANAKAVRNPSVKYVLDIIDLAQKNGAISTLNLPAVIGSGGKKTGGYSSQPGMETGASNFAQPYTDPEQNKVLKELTTELRELRKWRPNIAVETIEKKLNDYKEAIDKSGL